MEKILSRRGSKSKEVEAEAIETDKVEEPVAVVKDKGKGRAVSE